MTHPPQGQAEKRRGVLVTDAPNAGPGGMTSSACWATASYSRNSTPLRVSQNAMLTDATTDVIAYLTQLDEKVSRLTGIDQKLTEVLDLLVGQRTVKEKYTTAEVAQILGKRPFTVRQWCNEGRVHAEKAECGRGEDQEWRITHEELTRMRNEGLLPRRK